MKKKSKFYQNKNTLQCSEIYQELTRVIFTSMFNF